MTEQKSSVTTELNQECSLVQQVLPAYLHHELTAVQHQQIQHHLAECDSCAQRVQEARLLDADLQAEADRQQPRLSREAALRIQQQVYRRMQRSLVWQRTGQIVRLSTAVATLFLLLAGSFLFGRLWLPLLNSTANTDLIAAETSTAGETVSAPPAIRPEPTAVPAVPPAIVEIQPAEATVRENGRLHAWDSWTSVTPGQTPEQLAATIMDAALAQNETSLNELFLGMGATQQPTAKLWLHVGSRCQAYVTADDFLFARRPIPLLTVTSVSIWYNQHMVGEIKMRQVQGNWFATFARTPSMSPCLHR